MQKPWKLWKYASKAHKNVEKESIGPAQLGIFKSDIFEIKKIGHILTLCQRFCKADNPAHLYLQFIHHIKVLIWDIMIAVFHRVGYMIFKDYVRFVEH